MKDGKRTLMIVIEETGETLLDNSGKAGKGFNVYLAGDIERLQTVAEKDMSPAEFWGAKLFAICAHFIKEAGAVKNISKRGENQ